MHQRSAFAFALSALAACAAGSGDGIHPPGDTPDIDAPLAPPDAMIAAPDAPQVAPPDAMAAPPDAAPDASPPDAAPDANPNGPIVTLSGTAPTAYAGHTTSVGSALSNDVCPTGTVLTGLRGRQRMPDQYNGPLWPACRPIVLGGSPLALTTGAPTTEMTAHGDALAGDVLWTRDCPDNQVVVGLDGRSGAIVDQLIVDCAPLAVSAQPPFTVTTGAVTQLAAVGIGGGSLFSPIACPAGQIGRGASTYYDGDPTFGLKSIYLDGIAIVCTTPVVQ